MGEKALSTQGIANTYPAWSSVRTDSQSVGQQLINTVALNLDDLRRQNARIGANYHLATSICTDIDRYYRFKLPRTFDFQMTSDATELLFVPPRVTAWRNDISRAVLLAEKNEIENFWYNAIPTELVVEKSTPGFYQDYLIAQGNPINAPFVPIQQQVPMDNMRLTVTVEGTESCIQDINGAAVIGTVQITGFNSNVNLEEITEDVVFLYDDSIRTVNEFTSVSGIKVWGFEDPANANIMVTSNRFADPGLSEDPYHAIAYDLANYETGDGEPMPLYWILINDPIDNGDAARVALELHKYNVDSIEMRVAGFTDRGIAFGYDLLDSNNIPVTPVDICVEPYSRNLWVVTSGQLLLYSDAIDSPDLTGLDDKSYSAEAVIEPSSYQVVSGEEIGLDYVWRRPTKGMRRHRAWVEKPDGTLKSLEDGVEVTYHTDRTSWVVGEPPRKIIRHPEDYVLDQYGEYIYSLQVTYTDNTEVTDQRVILVAKKTPLAAFSLSEAGIADPAIGIDIDTTGQLVVFDVNNVRHYLGFSYDNMIIDIEKKIIYFRDQYDKVEVTY